MPRCTWYVPGMSCTVQCDAESALRIARLISTSSATPSQRKSGWSFGLVETSTAAGSIGGEITEVGPSPDLPQEASTTTNNIPAHWRDMLRYSDFGRMAVGIARRDPSLLAQRQVSGCRSDFTRNLEHASRNPHGTRRPDPGTSSREWGTGATPFRGP